MYADKHPSYLSFIIMAIFYWGEPHSNVENGMLVHAHKEPCQITELQYTTIVWCGGSCTSKHNVLMGTSIQMLCNAKIFGFVY